MADEKPAKPEKTEAAPAPDDKKPGKDKRPKKEEEEKKEERKGPAIKKLEGVKADFRYIVRMSNTDLSGARSVSYALTGIPGIGSRMAEVIADLAQVPRKERIGNLDDQQIDRVEKTIATLAEQVPTWMVNRGHDFSTGVDLHLVGNDVQIYRRDDINLMKMIRSYKGIRHEQGQKVRGQRTRANGRTGLTMGVTKKAVQDAAAAKKDEEKGGKGRKPAAAPGAPAAAAPAAAPAEKKKV